MLYSFFKKTLLIVSLPASLAAQDYTRLGGDLTSDRPGPSAVQVFAPNVTSAERRALQLSGFAPFHNIMQEVEGLGPRFVNSSCGGCHVQNGRGPIDFGRSSFGGGSIVVKVKPRRANANLQVGPVLQNHSVLGNTYHKLRLRWKLLKGTYPDGSIYVLRKPDLSFRVAGINSRKLAYSLRMSPALIGPGLLEAIPESAIQSLADPDDLNGDQISGKANYVLNLRTGQVVLGRFGFKAGQPTVEQQSAAALGNEMGVSNTLFPGADSAVLECSDDQLKRLVLYQHLGGVPAARNQSEPTIEEGKRLFTKVGCDSCHTATFVTGDHESPELVGQTIHPFTDSLLHDMGRGLSDMHSESMAEGYEWRTTPLWGLGYSETLSPVKQRYLHDGRARSIEEAILWHGGESKNSRDSFKKLSKEQRQALIDFLRSL